MEGELYVISEKQGASREAAKNDYRRLHASAHCLENKTDHPERFRATSRSDPEITKGFVIDSGTLWNDVNQFTETRNLIVPKSTYALQG